MLGINQITPTSTPQKNARSKLLVIVDNIKRYDTISFMLPRVDARYGPEGRPTRSDALRIVRTAALMNEGFRRKPPTESTTKFLNALRRIEDEQIFVAPFVTSDGLIGERMTNKPETIKSTYERVTSRDGNGQVSYAGRRTLGEDVLNDNLAAEAKEAFREYEGPLAVLRAVQVDGVTDQRAIRSLIDYYTRLIELQAQKK